MTIISLAQRPGKKLIIGVWKTTKTEPSNKTKNKPREPQEEIDEDAEQAESYMNDGQIDHEAEDTNPAIGSDEPKRLQQIIDKCCIRDQGNLNTNKINDTDKYPGFSRQKRVRLRAEQLFHERAAKKASRKQEVLEIKQRKKAEH
eukprot:11455791-Heterocapsa_arctica.AAC.2